ncbi:hypothetical protein SAMN05880574_1521 [Chryseobacterium sp. RU37D]|uniref:hypothetical protein n=1 Tax=Chryseobacterium sp. RU37D TaxID=1907397 RepID=UPI000956BD9E|nr:hypothetical protein [Chryseobacterium sp. RU37D]SIR01363.1 hypothetical protein SAMN05880574_1521 [Chryseobacterium sp. RU37D]
MKFLKITKALFIFLFTGAFQMALAQNENNEVPQWVKMMDDSNVNYYQAVKSFDDYWKDKEKPVEEKEIFKEKNSKIKEFENEETPKYAFEYKKFIYWRIKILPFVQDDGRILTKNELMEIWEKEKRNRNTN